MEAEHRNLKRSNKAEDSPPSPQTYRFSSDTAPRSSDTGDRYHQYHTPHDTAQHRRSESEDAKEAGGHTKGSLRYSTIRLRYSTTRLRYFTTRLQDASVGSVETTRAAHRRELER